MSLQLQFNLAGAWRNVLTFDEAELEVVMPAARTLLQAANRHSAGVRVMTPQGEVRLAMDVDGYRRDWPFRERRP